MSDLFILDARNVFKTLFEYRRAEETEVLPCVAVSHSCEGDLVPRSFAFPRTTFVLPATRCPFLPTHQSSGSHDGCQRDNSCFTIRRVFSVGFRGPCLLCGFSKPRVLPYSIQSIRYFFDFVNSDALQSSRVSRHGQDVR